MQFHHRRPRPPLDAFVESIWLYQGDPRPHALERVLPTGAAQLIVNLKEDQTRAYHPTRRQPIATASGTVLCGVRSSYTVIDTAGQEYVMGVAFRPGGTLPFVKVPAHELGESALGLEALWGRGSVSTLRDRLLSAPGVEAKLDAVERVLTGMWKEPSHHPAVAFALDVFERRPEAARIATIADAAGLSAKRFIDRFKAEVGITPKRYCRILRFQRAVAQAHRGEAVDWTRVAVDCGYFDQAHFIRDFHEFAGLTPSAYKAARTEFRNHVKLVKPLS